MISLLLEKHKLIRRGLVIWAAWLISWATIHIFRDLDKISVTAVSAYGLTVGILTTVIAFYQYHRAKEGPAQ